MDEDDYPNFGNAFPSASSTSETTATWNPALRPDTEEAHAEAPERGAEEDDDFFDRYPGSTPEKKQTHDEEAEDELSGSPIHRSSISVEHAVDVSQDPAAPEEVGMEPVSHADVEAPISNGEQEAASGDLDNEAAIFTADETAAEQAHDLEIASPQLPAEVEPTVMHGEQSAESVRQTDYAAEAEEAHRPEEHYDYQGELTEMEKAQDESAEAPLMEDEEPAPTVGSVHREPTMEAQNDELDDSFDGPRSPAPKAKHAPQQSLDRSFTTNFTEAPKPEIEEEEEPGRSRAVDQDWPAAGDDKTFGDLLDNRATEQAAPELVENAQRAADDGWGSTGQDEAFDSLLGGAQDAPRERSAEQEHTVNATDAWGTTSDDNTFGELLGGQNHQPSSLEAVAAQEASQQAAPDGAPSEDLSAAWAAALGDDDILDDNALDPHDLFGDDDELLPDDDEDDAFLADLQRPAQPQPTAPQPPATARAYTPVAAQQPARRPAPFAAPSTPFVETNLSRSSGTPDTGLFDVYNQPGALQQSQPQPPQRPPLSSAQSFVDKAKGGYQSPYDLPMEVVKPRRQPRQTSQPMSQAPAPPPRSSSFQGPPQAPPSVASMSPPTSSHGPGSMGPPPVPTSTTPKTTPKTDSGFFADLPMTAKPRVRPSGTYTPQSTGAPTPPMPPQSQFPPRPGPPPQTPSMQGPPVQTPPVQGGPVHPPPRPMAPPGPQQQQQPAMMGGLVRQAEHNPMFPDQPTPSVQELPPTPGATDRYSPISQAAAVPAPPSNRYSPAPAPHAQAPAATSRYSPAPAAQQQQQQPKTAQRYSSAPTAAPPLGRAQSFAPRTSSPLAMHGRPSHGQQQPAEEDGPRSMPMSPPSANGLGLSPRRQNSTGLQYTPPSTSASVPEQDYGSPYPGPPQRPRTQSPGAVMKSARTASYTAERPGSAGHAAGAHPTSAAPAVQPIRLAHRRQFSRDLAFVAPQDERAQDPLERWKGGPIFQWSASGTVVTSFPKQTPFYAAGHGIPSIKCTPGAVTTQDASTFMPLNDRDAKFPGPLSARSKGKKKDLLAWVSGKIEDLERETEGVLLDFNQPIDAKKRTEEKLVLWKIMRVYLEHDGALEGNPKIEEEVRRILLPNLAQMNQVAELQSPISATVQPDPVDTQVLAQIRQALFEGQRERAVWLAEEKKLWGHAMLLASTMGPDVWRQIISAFVRSQVKNVGSDARSLAALYQTFAGSADDCVDELVPPSARAGFQMISKADGSRAGNPLEGLDQWRETLALITSNRTPSDPQSLVALGKLLSSYGRVEAAHTCFLFARQVAKLSGAEDAEANFTLLGANAVEGDANLDAIMLTEIYEYATSLSAPSTAVHYIPHLQAYKLVHGQQLAAHGLKAKAESYTSHIDSAIRSTTRPSGYYHQALAQELISFNAFLSQTPHTGGSGKFFSKPAMDKVSSGVGSWFTKFVSGDEGEAVSDSSTPGAGAGPGEMSGPFGGVNGNAGSISRTTSQTDLYNPMMGGAPLATPFQPSSAPSKYAPGAASSLSNAAAAANKYAPSVPSQFAPSRTSMDSDRSYEPQPPNALPIPSANPIRPASARYASSYTPQAAVGEQSPQLLGLPRPGPERAASDYSVPYDGGSRRGSGYSAISNMSYEPKPVFAEQDGYGYQPPQAPQETTVLADDAEDAFGQETAHQSEAQPQGFDAEGGGSGYEPPSSSYEPPSYQPYQPEPEPEEDEAPKPRKKMMDDDDDDDITARAAALKSQTPAASTSKADADRQADAAFRAAAEADAARDAAKAGEKKGWFGGWFGGKKDPGLQGPGPIRAKLGEESSFYFDKDLNKWVNKKGGSDTATPAAATPPPPRGPPSSRATSGAMGPPASRAASGSSTPGTGAAGSRPPTSSGMPPSGPPSRVGTPAAAPPKPFAINGDGPPRPSSSMSTASSLDDLLGGPPGAGGKKAGTVKGKKKGGRYVDVMAK